jgi:UDPglucose--hexose-1-phosphate uridylyltransferase
MDIRRDPVTQSWVVTGYRENLAEPGGVCPLCSGLADQQPATLSWPEQGPWQVRVIPHMDPIYHAESSLDRKAEGIYDKMARAGAHEIIVETPQHDRPMARFSDEEIERVLWAAAQRIAELKKDPRFKYVTVFKNQGLLAGEEWPHAHSQLTATTFVPRRVKYELRSARQWFQQKDRCVFCDIVRQEEKSGQRIVDVQGEYYALCPYASRVPYEIWVLHRRHNHAFEHPRPGSKRRNLAALLGRTLRRLEKFAPAFHMVIHTAPNSLSRKGELAGYWKTLADDYHWHIEILPIVQPRGLSYGIKEVYVNAVLPEKAAEYLRGLDASS